MKLVDLMKMVKAMKTVNVRVCQSVLLSVRTLFEDMPNELDFDHLMGAVKATQGVNPEVLKKMLEYVPNELDYDRLMGVVKAAQDVNPDVLEMMLEYMHNELDFDHFRS